MSSECPGRLGDLEGADVSRPSPGGGPPVAPAAPTPACTQNAGAPAFWTCGSPAETRSLYSPRREPFPSQTKCGCDRLVTESGIALWGRPGARVPPEPQTRSEGLAGRPAPAGGPRGESKKAGARAGRRSRRRSSIDAKSREPPQPGRRRWPQEIMARGRYVFWHGAQGSRGHGGLGDGPFVGAA